MNGNGLLTQMGANQFTQSTDEIINDAQLTYRTDKNSATLGLLTWNVNMDVSQNGVDFLMDVTNQAHLVDVAAVNAAGPNLGTPTDNRVAPYLTGFTTRPVHQKSHFPFFYDT